MMSEEDSTATGSAPDRAGAAGTISEEIALAANADLTVLISAGPEESRAIALELARAGRCQQGALEVVDCREPDALTKHPLPARRRRPSVLLLQEVHALSRDAQSQLEEQLESVLGIPAAERVRVVSSSSRSLYAQVRRRRFQERLYYRLNMIHIVVPRSTARIGARDS